MYDGIMGFRGATYQVDDTMGSGLLARLLAVEEKTLASLRGPRHDVVGNVGGFLGLHIGSEVLGSHGVNREPEELLAVKEAPKKRVLVDPKGFVNGIKQSEVK